MTAKATQDEYIFRWGADSDPAAVARLRKTLQATVIERTPGWGFELWRCENPAAETLLAARLKDGGPPGLCSLLECIQANISVTASDFAADPGAQRLWGMHNTGQTGGVADADIDLPEAWDRSRGTGTLVAVLDTGVDYRHADLADNIWVNQAEIPGNGLDDDGNGYVDDVHGYDFAYNDGDPMDRHGHGTHVAGTIAAAADNGTGVAGVAPEAQIMALKFLDDSGTGSLFDAIQALDYAVMMGAQLSNNSWGGGQYHSALAEALALAADAGHLGGRRRRQYRHRYRQRPALSRQLFERGADFRGRQRRQRPFGRVFQLRPLRRGCRGPGRGNLFHPARRQLWQPAAAPPWPPPMSPASPLCCWPPTHNFSPKRSATC